MRKITLLAIAVFCIHSIVTAQITKGSTFLGGSVSFTGSSSKDENTPVQEMKVNGWSISPQFGKAIGNNKIVGVFLSFANSKNEATAGSQTQKFTSHFYSGGVFYRNYFPFASRFYLFGDASLGLGKGQDEQKTGTVLSNKSDRTAINLNITPGLSFAASKKLYLEAALNNLLNLFYQVNKLKTYSPTGTVTSSITQKQYGGAANSNGFSGISVGLRWILPSK